MRESSIHCRRCNNMIGCMIVDSNNQTSLYTEDSILYRLSFKNPKTIKGECAVCNATVVYRYVNTSEIILIKSRVHVCRDTDYDVYKCIRLYQDIHTIRRNFKEIVELVYQEHHLYHFAYQVLSHLVPKISRSYNIL